MGRVGGGRRAKGEENLRKKVVEGGGSMGEGREGSAEALWGRGDRRKEDGKLWSGGRKVRGEKQANSAKERRQGRRKDGGGAQRGWRMQGTEGGRMEE